MGEPIFQHLIEETEDAAASVVHFLDPRRYHSSQQDTTVPQPTATPGANVSLSTITDELEQGVAGTIAKFRQIATAVDNDPFVQATLNVADEVLPEVRKAAADLVPLLSAAPVPVLQSLVPILQALTAAHAAGAQTPPAA